MPAVTDRITVTQALVEFQSRPLKEAARHLLDSLGYRSDRSLTGHDSSPRSFLELFSAPGSEHGFDQQKALVAEWKTADLLFQLTDQELSRESSLFTDTSVKAGLIAAIDALKILDPACGSGAFPMGVLHKLVYILGKLDPDNERWKQTQLAKLDSAPMREELERAFADNNDDYGRKLYLIENCLYGVDIQPIAIQITHLHATLNAPSHAIRNRLLRLTADSPDLLAIIKQEGRV